MQPMSLIPASLSARAYSLTADGWVVGRLGRMEFVGCQPQERLCSFCGAVVFRLAARGREQGPDSEALVWAVVFRKAARGREQEPVCQAMVLGTLLCRVNRSQALHLRSAAQQRHAADRLNRGVFERHLLRRLPLMAGSLGGFITGFAIIDLVTL